MFERLAERWMLVHEGEISMINIGCDIGKNNLDVYVEGNQGGIKMTKRG